MTSHAALPRDNTVVPAPAPEDLAFPSPRLIDAAAANDAAVATAPASKPAWRRWAGPVAALAAFGAILFLLSRLAADIDAGTVLEAAAATPMRAVAASLIFSAISYLALIGYDACGVRAATATTVPMRTIALGSFTSYSIGHALGFPLVTAGAVRWRIYGRAGLTGPEVAKLTAVAGVMLWVGVAAVIGLSAVLAPSALTLLDRLSPEVNRIAGIAILAALVGFAVWSGKEGRSVGRGRAELRLAGTKLVFLQIALGVVDVAASALALYVLMPSDLPVGFIGFAAVFAGAIPFAAASHAPAGLGTFEAAVLLAFPQAQASGLLSGLLLWRVTYTLIPFLLALALLGIHEVRVRYTMPEKLRQARRLAVHFAPTALAALTFVGGLVLLTSGALPDDYTRVKALRHLIPLPFAEVSHLIGSTAGVILLLLAHGLRRRLASAWTLSVVVIGAGMAVSLLKGFDWEEATVLGAVLILLVANRQAFYRKAGIFAEPLNPLWILAIAVILGSVIWLGLATYGDVDYSHELWWKFAWSADASRFLRSSLVAVVVATAISFHALIHHRRRPVASSPVPSDVLESALAHADRADAQLAWLDDKRFLVHETGDAFLMYAVRGKSWIAMGDPVGPAERAPDLMWQFLEEVDKHAGWPVFYQVSPAHLPLYLDGGLSLVKLGEEAKVDLSTFTTEGRAGRDFRNALNRAKRDGLEFAVIPKDEVPCHLDELKAVSDAWLAERGSGEKGFSIGFWSADYLSRFDVAVVRKEGRILAFANIWYGQKGGEITIDLMRNLPDMPGTMDLLFVSLMQVGRDLGYRWFNLGMAPLSGLSEHRLAPSWHKIAAFVARNGERFYGFKGLRAYKEKFGPVWEPRYLASPGGWATPQILFDVASLISGSPIKAVTKGAK
jgi:phosphatidylglycerol lysyltransferase